VLHTCRAVAYQKLLQALAKVGCVEAPPEMPPVVDGAMKGAKKAFGQAQLIMTDTRHYCRVSIDSANSPLVDRRLQGEADTPFLILQLLVIIRYYANYVL
jgi:hypothetical protein